MTNMQIGFNGLQRIKVVYLSKQYSYYYPIISAVVLFSANSLLSLKLVHLYFVIEAGCYQLHYCTLIDSCLIAFPPFVDIKEYQICIPALVVNRYQHTNVYNSFTFFGVDHMVFFPPFLCLQSRCVQRMWFYMSCRATKTTNYLHN